ncbi:hypothetical protein [Fluviibacter phosphoraccumulans]|jgi:hypothetical protein|uniref:Uncharacterized protein n=1 Tax=Fluviibacter phosphoraccumulans TaxID=1751046 RepID=A0A679HVP2_9RHOO|nr:hypothetical protein [Fluviibacter phosphoraccumulans]BBU67814.1 hypothetical protein ICHIAU1_00970 [Fluviibacter phosphoraccumulans]BBU70647.1 hypothetical protein ICHIJ1_05660 [Fluviibacter phosphoraccumulans]BCA65998.1 hypothetical protein SHINM1_016000 [Fluviibacter phosphoraccumulans]
MKQLPVVLAALILAVTPLALADIADTPDRTPLAGKTAKGEDVLLFPNGRWEYVNTTKAAEAKKVAEQFPENKLRPEGAQGGVFGIGRYIMPGDKDYNRRSLSGK